MMFRDWRICIRPLLRLSAHVAVLVALGLRLVLPLLGPEAVGLQADHKHLILGGSPADKAQALARHRHVPLPYAKTLSVTPAANPTTAHVISITGHEGLGPTVVETAALNFHVSSVPSPAVIPSWSERLPETAAQGEGICLAIPSPPPRSAYRSV